MLLNSDFVERNLSKSEGLLVFGNPVNDLTKDELVALIVYLNSKIDLCYKEKQNERYIITC